MEKEPVKVFLVEDEAQIANFLALELRHEGYEVAVEYNGKKAFQRLKKEKYDILLLDWMLPGMDGIDICRKLRPGSDKPIIMLTAKGDVKNRIEGMKAGADDYVVKPFAFEELLRRMQMLLNKYRRIEAAEDEILQIGDVTVNTTLCEVRLHDEIVELSMKEYKILEYLLRSKRKVVTKDDILKCIWSYEFSGSTSMVDVYMHNLRQKLEEANDNKRFIYTVRGIGYVIRGY